MLQGCLTVLSLDYGLVSLPSNTITGVVCMWAGRIIANEFEDIAPVYAHRFSL